jgi:hypothetical protein
VHKMTMMMMNRDRSEKDECRAPIFVFDETVNKQKR